MIQYNQFFRSFGLRTDGQLKAPPLPKLERFELPVLSMVHFIPQSATNLWPSEGWLMYQKNKKPIRLVNHLDLINPVGGPRLRTGDFIAKQRTFRKDNPRFRVALELEEMKREERAIVTHNYGLLFERWKYQRGMFANINRWNNVFTTMFATAGEAVGSGYRQYFELTMPHKLPAITVLQKAENGWNNRNIPLFNSYQMLMLHHLWMWLGENRHKGMMAKNLPKGVKGMHLILREGERFCVVDLSILDSWRKPSAHEQKLWQEQREENPGIPRLPRGKYAPQQLQKVFLRLMMSVMQVRAEDIPENLGDEEGTNDAENEKVLDNVIASGPDESVDKVPDAKSSTVDGEQTEEEAFAGYSDADHEREMAELEKDLEALELVGETETDENAIDGLADGDDVDVFADDTEPGQDPAEEEKAAEAPEKKKAVQFFPEEPLDAFKAVCNKAADDGFITAAEYRKLLEMNELTANLPAPMGQEGTLSSFVKIDSKVVKIDPDDPEIKIPEIATVTDKSMLSSTLQVMDKRYATELFQKDVAGMVTQLAAAGVVVKSYNVEEKEDITGTHFEYTIQIKPIEGASSTLRFKLPKIEDDGNFKINGVPYRLRKQRGDLPIRVLGPDRVALTSYYGKVNIFRSERRVNDYGKWLTNAIMARGLDPKDQTITGIVPGNAWGPDLKAPRAYSMIAQCFRAFNLMIEGEMFHCEWDASKAMRLRMQGSPIVVAQNSETGTRLLMEESGKLVIDRKGQGFLPAPSIEEILGLNVSKAPVQFAEVKIFAKMVPLGVVLGYLLGFQNLLGLLKSSYREVLPGKRVGLTGDEWAIVFDDKTYVFSRSDHLTTMVLGGWREHYNTTSRFPSEEFNRQDVYFNLFEEAKFGVRTMREIDLLEQMFVDPITRELLRDMNEPVVFTKLLIRAGELLTTDEHPNEQDTKLMRIKGYERFSGAVYAELVKSVRIHNSRPGKHRYGVEMNPYAVWIAIQQDPAKDQVSEINPIQNLKEQEAVTYSGTGGRGSRSMVKSTRVYHKNDMGVISESTVDSGDVAINVFTSANPVFNSLRGTADEYSFEKNGPASLLSTSALVSPGSTKDDPKRVNFIGIQNRHVVACDGYTQAAVRTGYEQVIPHRTGDLFAVTAKKPGKVVGRNDDGLIVEYADGTRQGITLGKRFGNAAGLTIPHHIHSDLKEGDAFEVGEPLAWNTGFFERDVLNPKQVIWKSATMARVVLMESPDTLEDSSAISLALSKKLMTEQVKIKDIIINFDQAVHKLVKEGEKVEPESILCYIEDEISARTNHGLDDETLDTLRVLGAQTPQAKVQGKVDRIEIFYNGDIEDMSDTLRSAVLASDKRIIARNTSIDRKGYTGSVGGDFRIGADPLLIDTACIRIYMSAKVPAGVGDKGVFANQMKTVFGRVFSDNVRTESGLPIDAIFGAKSVDDRIVTSPDLIGTTNTLLRVGAQRVVRAYRTGKA